MAKGTGKAVTSAALQAAADVVAQAGAARAARTGRQQAVLSAADRENPDRLTGEALRQLAHRRGIARSEAERMDDAKLRLQLRLITNRQYADEEA